MRSTCISHCRSLACSTCCRVADQAGSWTFVRSRPGAGRRDGCGAGELVRSSGDTFPHRELIKRQGGRWSASRQRWCSASHDGGVAGRGWPRRPPAFETPPTAFGLGQQALSRPSRAAAPAGFLRGRPEALADYELLELLLFFSIYRRDTKPLAKEMLDALRRPRRRAGGGAEPATPSASAPVPAACRRPEPREMRDDDLRFTTRCCSRPSTSCCSGC